MASSSAIASANRAKALAASSGEAGASSSNDANAEELKAAQAEEHARQQARDEEINNSWKKSILTAGKGKTAVKGQQVRLHVVGTFILDKAVQGRAKERGFVSGTVFEDSRARDVPLLLLLGRGTLVPGLDRALIGMVEGEKAEITVSPEGGYGAAGSVEHPCVPGSATLKYEVELLSIDEETALWDMDFAEKMKWATERRQRGNTLVGGGHFLMADAEYEQALRYLVFMPHPEPQEIPIINEAKGAVHLNLAATKLRMGEEAQAIKNANDALACLGDDKPKVSKAHYRLGQAHTQLGKYTRAREHFQKAEEAAGSDSAAVSAIWKERERLDRRQEKHTRDRKKAAARMVSGEEAKEDGKDAAANAQTGMVSRLWKRLVATGPGQAAASMMAAAVVVALLALLAQLLVMALHGLSRVYVDYVVP